MRFYQQLALKCRELERKCLIVDGVRQRIGNLPWFKDADMSVVTANMTVDEAVDRATSSTIYRDSPYLAGPDIAL